MKKILIHSVFIWIIFSIQASAEDIDSSQTPSQGIFELGFVFGKTDLAIDSDFSLSRENDFAESLTIGIELGYLWQRGFLIEMSFNQTINEAVINLGDDYELYQWNTLIGYSFELSNNFRFIPKLGVSKWKLDTQDGLFSFNDPDIQHRFNDTDFTYELGFEIPVAHDLTFNLAYTNTKYSFGEISIANFGITFEF
jgi:hypothetical protein